MIHDPITQIKMLAFKIKASIFHTHTDIFFSDFTGNRCPFLWLLHAWDCAERWETAKRRSASLKTS